MKRTRAECVQSLQEQLDRMPEKQRDLVFVACACGEHEYTPRTLLEAIKDESNEDGTAFYEAWAKLEEELENEVNS